MNPSDSPPRKRYRKFDKTFKREALDLWRQSGKSGSEIAAELGIRANNLYAWAAKEQSQPAPSHTASAQEMAAQIATLQRENERLRQQRDILKKTLGILAELPSNPSNASIK
jgi:transposase